MAGLGIVAADPKVIPLGTKIKINGKSYTVKDKGGAIRGRRLDIWMPCGQAKLFGRRTVFVTF